MQGTRSNYYSSHASLWVSGVWLRGQVIWEVIADQVKIKQKTIIHTPQEKLLDALINILRGGAGI